MVLVDTSVWIDHFRKHDDVLAELLIKNNVLTHPFVRGELALGNLRQRDIILNLLDNLPQAGVAYSEEINFFIEKNALFGLGIGLIDVHLLSSAQIAQSTMLWTRDKKLMSAAVRLNLAAIFDIEQN